MFSKSYTDGSIYKSSAAFVYFNYNIDNLLKEYKVDDLKELSEINSPAGVLEMFNPPNPEWKKQISERQAFTNGVLNYILNRYYDGEQRQFDEFAKKVFMEAFNEGFGRNYGKMLHKHFIQRKHTNATFWVKGETWAVDIINQYEQNL